MTYFLIKGQREIIVTNIAKITIFAITLFMFRSEWVISANENNGVGGRAAGMSSTCIGLRDEWAVLNNQAGLAGLSDLAAGFYYGNLFMINETGYRAGVFILPTRSGNFGLGITHFGFSGYNESQIGIAYARMFGPKFSAGLKLNYYHQGVTGDYHTVNYLTFEVGIQSDLTDQLSIAAHAYNPAGFFFEDGKKDQIPSLLRLGVSFSLTEHVLLCFQADKDLIHPVNFRLGTEIQIINQFFIRAGTTTNPFTNSFGAGMLLKKLKIDIAGSVHYVLGYSLHVSLQYSIKEMIK